MSQTILITGASRGTGLAAAILLASKGAHIVLVARSGALLTQNLALLRAAARQPSTQRFTALPADLTSPDEATRIIAEATAWNDGAPPDIVWCLAGASWPTLFADTEISKFREQMDANYFTAVHTAHATLNAWKKQQLHDKGNDDARHLIFTGSFLSFYSIAGYTPYSPTRAAIRSLADGLAQEMELYAGAHPAARRVRVHAVFPGTILTESYEAENLVKSDLTKMLEGPNGGLSAEQVAERSVRGLERGEALIATDWMTRIVMCGVLGGSSRRGGVWKGVVDCLVGIVIAVVMIVVRLDMDRQVREFGRRYGDSGMKKEVKQL